MTTRGEQMVSEIQARMTQLEAVLEPLDARTWVRRCEAEAWTIGWSPITLGVVSTVRPGGSKTR